jgi:hypothetical protein
LALDGWRRIRTDLQHLRGLGVQEKGMADDIYVRYGGFLANLNYSAMREMLPKKDELACLTQVLWIEWKRRTGKAMAHQHAWHANERARGALTLIAGIDFVASVDGFMVFYKNSGLSRNIKWESINIRSTESGKP